MLIPIDNIKGSADASNDTTLKPCMMQLLMKEDCYTLYKHSID